MFESLHSARSGDVASVGIKIHFKHELPNDLTPTNHNAVKQTP